jgi:hypothetical protein
MPRELSGRALMHLVTASEQVMKMGGLSEWGKTSLKAALVEAYQALEGVKIEVVEGENDD